MSNAKNTALADFSVFMNSVRKEPMHEPGANMKTNANTNENNF